MLSLAWYKFLKKVGSFPNDRNMSTINLFDSLKGKGLDIGHDGRYNFKNGNVVRMNIHSGEHVDVITDGKNYPFENETFDRILIRCVLEHVDNPSYILREAYRILKSNGKIIIEVPFINPIHGAPDDFYRFTPNGLKKILEDEKYFIEKIFYVEDTNWAIRWILWQKLKNTKKVTFLFLFKMIVLKYFIIPILFRINKPSKDDFSSFGMQVVKIVD